MTGKLPSTIRGKAPALLAIALLLGVWQLLCLSGVVPSYMLPSPAEVVRAFAGDWSALWRNAAVTLKEAFLGLGIGIVLGFVFAVLMDAFPLLYRAFYPILVLTQTVPTVAIAPLLVLWFGYETLPKVILVVMIVFFPITVGLLDGFRAANPDAVNLLRSMGAGKGQIFRYLKAPSALPQFFSGVRIASAYAVVGAVIAEWLGGFGGLGVYMTRVRKAFAFDKMFAVIFLISIISLLLIALVNALARWCMPYRQGDRQRHTEERNPL